VRIVAEWEMGVYLVAGKYRGTVGPGLKLVFPGLCDVRCVPVVPEIYSTSLQSVTLRDGSNLTYSASITVVVRDAAAAYCKIGHHAETVVELAARIVSEGLADADPERFDPARGKRDRLLNELREDINEVCNRYGLDVTCLGFNNFVRGVRTVRLLLDQAVLADPYRKPDAAG
jgi:hypothetical protein